MFNNPVLVAQPNPKNHWVKVHSTECFWAPPFNRYARLTISLSVCYSVMLFCRSAFCQCRSKDIVWFTYGSVHIRLYRNVLISVDKFKIWLYFKHKFDNFVLLWVQNGDQIWILHPWLWYYLDERKALMFSVEVVEIHGPACIAFHCSHLYITNPGSVSRFAKTWVSLQTTTYMNKSTKYFDILLLLTCGEVLHPPIFQIWAQNSTILTPNNLVLGLRWQTTWTDIILTDMTI